MPSPSDSSAERYDSTTISFHWTTAVLVALLWTVGQTIDFFPKGMLRIGARSTHILTGATLLVIVVARLMWRSTRGRRLPAAVPGAAGQLARAGHIALYFLLATTLLLGAANAWIRGDSIFGLLTISSIAPGNKVLRGQVEDLHGTFANITVILAGVHAVVALFHHWRGHQNVLRRMLSVPKAP